MSLKNHVETLTSLCGVSGHEFMAAPEIERMFLNYGLETSIDALGNVTGVLRGTPGGGRVMLEAHMDEIGLMVTGILENGFLTFTTVGGIDERILPASEVTVHGKQPLFGVIGAKPPHLLKAEEKDKPVPKDRLFIDIGYTKQEAEKLVSVGDTVTFRTRPACLNNDFFTAKAQDDRTSIAVMLSVLERLLHTALPFDLYVVAAVQEEVGRRGSRTAAYQIDPTFAIAIDVCHADTPDAKENTFPAGGGTVLSLGPNLHPVLVQKIRQVLDKAGILYQIDVDGGDTGTDAWAIQIAKNGIPTALFSLPLRYMHTSGETVDLKDATATAAAIAAFLKSLGKAEDALC